MRAVLRVDIARASNLRVGQVLDVTAKAFVVSVEGDLLDVSSLQYPECSVLGAGAEVVLEVDLLDLKETM